MKITTAHAAIAAYFANGNPELTELYNRCQFAIDDTAFTITCKKKNVEQFTDDKLLDIAITVKQLGVRWFILRTKKQIIFHAETELMIRWHLFVIRSQLEK